MNFNFHEWIRLTKWNYLLFSVFPATTSEFTNKIVILLPHSFLSIFNLQSSLTNFYSFYYKILMPFPLLFRLIPLCLWSIHIQTSHWIYLMDTKKKVFKIEISCQLQPSKKETSFFFRKGFCVCLWMRMCAGKKSWKLFLIITTGVWKEVALHNLMWG